MNANETATATATRKTMMPGGWTSFKSLTAADEKVFHEAMEGHVGAKYIPEKVAKQVVNGTNYRFMCHGKLATQDAHWFPAMVKIHKPINGRATIEKIERILNQ